MNDSAHLGRILPRCIPYAAPTRCNLSSSGKSHNGRQIPRRLPMRLTRSIALVVSKRKSPFRVNCASLFLLLAFLSLPANAQTAPPAKGQIAPDFTLSTLSGTHVRLSDRANKGTTVLVILRGYPGYQCPFCQKQAHDFIAHASEFAKKQTNVLLVYPGPPADLDRRAKEFLQKQAALPDNITLVTDPDYGVTNLYGLRWNAPEETAYPSTFLLDNKRVVMYEKISREHGDRTTANEVLAEIHN
jgi:thioredoxin-dependent peroxiredoxin